MRGRANNSGFIFDDLSSKRTTIGDFSVNRYNMFSVT